jgi:hypothetical protein
MKKKLLAHLIDVTIRRAFCCGLVGLAPADGEQANKDDFGHRLYLRWNC